MKKLISALLLLSLLVGVLCACNPFYDPEQAALDELYRHYNEELEAYPTLYTPKKDPSALENYDTLYQSAQTIANRGRLLSLKHYLIPERITSNEVTYLTAYLTKADFETEEQFFNACLYQQILLDSFGTSTEEFLEKTGSMTEQERAAYTEERLQMLKYVAAQPKEWEGWFYYAFISLEKALLKDPDTFCCYDLQLRNALDQYRVVSITDFESEWIRERWEINKVRYDEYTAGADAKTVYDKLIREQQELKKSYEE